MATRTIKVCDGCGAEQEGDVPHHWTQEYVKVEMRWPYGASHNMCKMVAEVCRDCQIALDKHMKAFKWPTK